MATEKVEASLPKEEKSVAIDFDFGDNLQDAVKKFGEDVVFANFKSSVRIALQGVMRGLLKAGKDVAAECAEWKPGIRQPGKTKVEKADEILAGLSEEQRAELLAKFAKGKK